MKETRRVSTTGDNVGTSQMEAESGLCQMHFDVVEISGSGGGYTDPVHTGSVQKRRVESWTQPVSPTSSPRTWAAAFTSATAPIPVPEVPAAETIRRAPLGSAVRSLCV